MRYYIESSSTDPHFNLALEQYVFDCLDQNHDYLMFWQNENAIIIGKHQNTIAEIDTDYVRNNEIHVVRRLSGGGAVYHDLGNLNFTFIVKQQETAFDFASFCRPVQQALLTLGVRAEISGRNDMTIDGKKFSGNAQYIKNNRVMHHGTIMYDSNLDILSKALRVSEDKLSSRGLASVRSRVTNIRPYMAEDVPLEMFKRMLHSYMSKEYALDSYHLSDHDLLAIEELKHQVYDSWDWNYGASPPYSIQRSRRIEGCGKLELYMDITQGRIRDFKVYGDFFAQRDPAELTALLVGSKLHETHLKQILEGVDTRSYIRGLDATALIELLLGHS